MPCSSCGTENPSGRKFCGKCGAPLATVCPSCGASNDAQFDFCGECGSPLSASASTPAVLNAASASAALRAAPVAERRLVSVLFADLVGFTTLSESRDAEEVRELLSRYFDTCRKLISRYGGVVEKFIGDAVMAVWGAPVATEDDAERAVRAALELTKSVADLGAEIGAPSLRARAGVLTGEAAVNIGAVGEGMVAGDLVNTASRIQSVAQPGDVLVGESTRRASEAAIIYEDAGAFELKGKAEPTHLLRAVRVVAGSLGALRPSTLEAPFVGRDREMRVIKDLFHSSSEERIAQLVSVTGIGGIGKSRLSWELEKYVEGLAVQSLWHRGRCLSYGDGVAYWALVDMVKMRCRIAEEEGTDSATAKLRATIAEFIPDEQEQRWVEPRLAHLLALDGGASGDQENVFSAWRIFFERLADRHPVVMVFEDMQWADAGLLDFIEYLLEWSRNHPIFIVTLARPELVDKRPNWGAGKRNFGSLYLEPLSAPAMEELLSGLVPGLPDEVRGQILDRAQGVPLYAVETVRMLLDRELLVREGSVYRPTGPIESLEVPETLHALIAARLDGLSPDERHVVQVGAILGKTFFKQGVASVSGLSEEEVEPLLASLTRKEVLSLQADPRSPERGQYGFLQDLVKKVAYDTLSKKDRKAKHLAAAAFIQEAWTGEEDEIVEVVASHFLEAYRAAPEAGDANEIKGRSAEMLARAGERAASLAASGEAQRYFEQAGELTEDPTVRAGLLERAGQMAWAAARPRAATDLFEKAIALYEGNDQGHAAARVSARLGEVTWTEGHIDHAVRRMEESFAVLSTDSPDEDLAWLAAQLGRFQYFSGDVDSAVAQIEQALDMAESLWLPEVLSQALNTKGIILATTKGRPEEGLALLRHALQVALDHQAPSAALRAYYNLLDNLYYRDRFAESLPNMREGLALARRQGDRNWEWSFLAATVIVLFLTGEWDEALKQAAQIPHLENFAATRFASVELLMTIPALLAARGETDGAAEALAVFEEFADSSDMQERSAYRSAQAVVFSAQGRFAEAFSAGTSALETRGTLGLVFPSVKTGFVEAAEAAFELGDLDAVEELLAVVQEVRAGDTTPQLRAHSLRFQARLDSAQGPAEGVEQGYRSAAALFREIGMPYWLAVAVAEHGLWLAGQGRSGEAEPLLSEARQIFERLKARPWLERMDQPHAAVSVAAPRN
jgi:predicted ATPase/class 3 adenylate cyclase